MTAVSLQWQAENKGQLIKMKGAATYFSFYQLIKNIWESIPGIETWIGICNLFPLEKTVLFGNGVKEAAQFFHSVFKMIALSYEMTSQTQSLHYPIVEDFFFSVQEYVTDSGRIPCLLTL